MVHTLAEVKNFVEPQAQRLLIGEDPEAGRTCVTPFGEDIEAIAPDLEALLRRGAAAVVVDCVVGSTESSPCVETLKLAASCAWPMRPSWSMRPRTGDGGRAPQARARGVRRPRRAWPARPSS